MKLILSACAVALCAADLRKACQPKSLWKVQSRGPVKFVKKETLYMEPSDFNYEGLKKQRDGGGYDNFLRSNIDNQQDRRNFKTEAGEDHLPFRSFQCGATDAHSSQLRKTSSAPTGPATRVAVGTPYAEPLRWNNPHAAELEVNVWLMKTTGGPVVVPIRLPTCSAEGHQDNVFTWTIPTDFNEIAVPGFAGCKKSGDCVLQVYAHSVESRTYASGVPLIVEGIYTGTGSPDVADAPMDVNLDLDKLENEVCLPSSDPSANIVKSIPQKPRLSSDVFNHAFQNSDFSPYHGQNPTKISKQMQASCLLKMVPGNRGELGKRYFGKMNRNGARAAKKADKKARGLIKFYETITNRIIGMLEMERKAVNTDTSMESLTKQKTDTCFRCKNVGATTAKRLKTNTYVPSFKIAGSPTNGDCAEAKRYVSEVDSHLISGTCMLKIYTSVWDDMNTDFVNLGTMGVGYMSARLNDKCGTLEHITKFMKTKPADKDGETTDNGEYASEAVWDSIVNIPVTASSNGFAVESLEDFFVEEQKDPNGLNKDADCDDDRKYAADPTMVCAIDGQNQQKPGQLFAGEGDEAYGSPASAVGASWVAAVAVVVAAGFQY